MHPDSPRPRRRRMGNDPRDLDGQRLQQRHAPPGPRPGAAPRLLALLRRAEASSSAPARCATTSPDRSPTRCTTTRPLREDAGRRHALQVPVPHQDRTRLPDVRARTSVARVGAADHAAAARAGARAALAMSLVGGAYFGDQAILLARSVQPRGRLVHCFEPNADAGRDAGRATCQLNRLRQRASCNALRAVVEQRRARSGSTASIPSPTRWMPTPGDHDAFDTISIDDYRADHGLHIGLIQLDIEGAEFQAPARRRGDAWRATGPHVVFEVHRHYVDWSRGLPQTDLCRYLAGLGYTLYALRDFNSHREMGQRARSSWCRPTASISKARRTASTCWRCRIRQRLQSADFRIVEQRQPQAAGAQGPGAAPSAGRAVRRRAPRRCRRRAMRQRRHRRQPASSAGTCCSTLRDDGLRGCTTRLATACAGSTGPLGHVFYCAGLTADYAQRPHDTVEAHVVAAQPGAAARPLRLAGLPVVDTAVRRPRWCDRRRSKDTAAGARPGASRATCTTCPRRWASRCATRRAAAARASPGCPASTGDADDADGFLRQLLRRVPGAVAQAEAGQPPRLRRRLHAARGARLRAPGRRARRRWC